MATKLEPKVPAMGLMDAMELAVFKSVTEAIATPIVGNSTVTSGIAKLATGGIVNGTTKNTHAKLFGGAMVVDGVEDIAHAVIMPIIGGVTGRGEVTGRGGSNGRTAWNQ